MPRVKDQAFIIGKTDYGESDLIISLFSLSRGRISAIAKGAKRSRRRFPGTLEIFSLVTFEGFIKNPLALTRIDECRLIRPFPAIQEHLERYFWACYLIEIISRCCPERQAGREIFKLLEELMAFLDNPKNIRNFNCQMRLFELQIIGLLGYQPDFSDCRLCGRTFSEKEALYFSPASGGLLCESCAHASLSALPVSRGTVSLLRQAPRLDPELRGKLNFTPQVERESAALCRALLRWHSGCEFRSLTIMEKFFARERRQPANYLRAAERSEEYSTSNK